MNKELLYRTILRASQEYQAMSKGNHFPGESRTTHIVNALMPKLEEDKRRENMDNKPHIWTICDLYHNNIRIRCEATCSGSRGASEIMEAFREMLNKCFNYNPAYDDKMRDGIASLAADWVDNPEDIFNSEQLDKWAIDHGYVREREEI